MNVNEYYTAPKGFKLPGWDGVLCVLVFCLSLMPFYGTGRAQSTNSLAIKYVVANKKHFAPPFRDNLNLGISPGSVSFIFGSASSNAQPPLRLRGKLEGFESHWHEGEGDMSLAIRFCTASRDQIDEKIFPVGGESAGWNGSVKSSALAHRRETLVVPSNASQAIVVISSGGPPSAVGVYVIENLVMTKFHNNSAPVVLLQSPSEIRSAGRASETPANWIRDGDHSSMARIIHIGEEPSTLAFALEDDDVGGHAEWHTIPGPGSDVSPGDQLVIEWNEMYSIGVADLRSVMYPELPPGNYQFRVQGIDLMGKLEGNEAFVKVFVPQPLWGRPWFLVVLVVILVATIAGSAQYVTSKKMRREMMMLTNQKAVEIERLRIARDIHDDLGTLVTQLSMASTMSFQNLPMSETTRTEIGQIKQMARDLVSALYETSWAIDPKNDNLDALANHLCLMVSQICSQASLQSRFYVSELPSGMQVSSQVRHNIMVVIKEVIRNVILHAKASNVTVQIDLKSGQLDIAIKDNGCGFQPVDDLPGNGLASMKKRVKNMGGACFIDSKMGLGTTVHLCLHVGDDAGAKS